MSDLVRSEVEAALEYANNLLGTHLRRDRIQPALDAARVWLSTPTKPTDEQIETGIREVEAAARVYLPMVLWADGPHDLYHVSWEDASEAMRDHARDAVAEILEAASRV